MKKRKHIRLGVNIDHAATLRQVRGGTTAYPDLMNIASLAISGGADQITIHLREDRRHIQDADLELLARECPVPLNLEMACSEKMLKIALKNRPDWVCFVPEKRQELTTEGGLDVVRMKSKLQGMVEKLQEKGIESSMFIAPDLKQVKASFEAGADAIEFHTGHWVLWSQQGQKKKAEKEWNRMFEASQYAASMGLRVHAGHGLDFFTTQEVLELPFLEEVNIGHSIICYSLEYGIEKTTSLFRRVLDGKNLVF